MSMRSLSQEARKDLIFIAVGVAAIFVFELVTEVFDKLFYAVDEIHQSVPLVDAGEFIAVPLALSIGFGYFSYRRYQELSATVAARATAQRAAEAAQRRAEQAQQEARDAQRLSQTLMETGMNALVKVDREGNITEVNEGMEVATGMRGSNLVGTSAFSFFGNSGQTREWFEQSLQGNAVRDGQTEIVHQDGGVTHVNFSVLAQRDGDGEVLGAILILRPREEALT